MPIYTLSTETVSWMENIQGKTLKCSTFFVQRFRPPCLELHTITNHVLPPKNPAIIIHLLTASPGGRGASEMTVNIRKLHFYSEVSIAVLYLLSCLHTFVGTGGQDYLPSICDSYPVSDETLHFYETGPIFSRLACPKKAPSLSERASSYKDHDGRETELNNYYYHQHP